MYELTRNIFAERELKNDLEFNYVPEYKELNATLESFITFVCNKYPSKDSITLDTLKTLQKDVCNDLKESLKQIRTDKNDELLPVDFFNPDSKTMEIDLKEFIATNRSVLIQFLDDLSISFNNNFIIAVDFKKTFFEEYFNKTINKLDSMIEDWKSNKTDYCVSTGYKKIDDLLGGGLYSGLYTIGAVTSLGKTTFCLNICDNIARSGSDVMIFSTEMDESEYIKRSLSRLSYEKAKTSEECISERNILSRSDYCNPELMNNIIQEYKKFATRYEIIKGIGDTTTDKIDQYIKTHIEITHKKPVVVIDFFQLLEINDYRYSDKQKADRNVLQLKKIADKYKIPMLVISSFNRTSYKQPVSLESFKESGNIEYISENVIALQYSFMKTLDFTKKEAEVRNQFNSKFTMNNERTKQGKSIEIDVCVLKARKGSKGEITFNYVPMFNYMTEEKPKFDTDPEPAEGQEMNDSAEEKANRPKTMKEILSGKNNK